jgi:4-amino-4-deoxy-L-arabinose transferase-like glycosyltransferase
MIQRIQTVWLLLASIAAFLTLKLSFFSGNKVDAITSAKQFLPLTAKTNDILLVLTVSVAVAALVIIFLYKDRKRQMMVTSAILVLSVINIILYFTETKKFVEGSFNLTALIAFFIPVFLAFALGAIWKDEKLVKSTDRLR